MRGKCAVGVNDGKRGHGNSYEKSDEETDGAEDIDEYEEPHEAEQRPFVSVRDLFAFTHRLDGAEAFIDNDVRGKHKHETENNSRHDEQNESEYNDDADEKFRTEKIPERLRMPELAALRRFDGVVRLEEKCGDSHAEHRAEHEIDEASDDLRRALITEGAADAREYAAQDGDKKCDAYENQRTLFKCFPAETDAFRRRECVHKSQCNISNGRDNIDYPECQPAAK